MPKTKTAQTKSKRSHSFGGCGTCRRRHVKCDQVQPKCLTCQAVGVECTGYASELRWISAPNDGSSKDSNPLDSGPRPARKHLYSESTQALMSDALQSHHATKPIDDSLTEVDARSKDVASGPNSDFAVGPFGVFTLSNQFINVAGDVSKEPGAQDGDPAARTPQTVDSADSLTNLNNWLDWPDLFQLDFSYPDMMGSGLDSSLYNIGLLSGQHLDEQTTEPGEALANRLEQSQSHLSLARNREPMITASTSKLRSLEPAMAEMLLKNFQDNLIMQMAPLPLGNKSVWEITTIPSAILTLARSTYMATPQVSRAALANLLATCATSAKHMATHTAQQNTELSNWEIIAARLIQEAKEEMQFSLRNETRGLKVAKYKDQLMALCAMMTFAILYDKQQDARAYMVDAERLLRTRGLAKQVISRKARSLHHVYTWIRIIGESTYVLRSYENAELVAAVRVHTNAAKRRKLDDSQNEVTDQDYRDGHNPRLDDFLRLDPSFSKTGKDVSDTKDQEAGLHDIHLEDSREWSGGLYMQLYGLSETWLSLVSQTTRLANVLDSLSGSKDRKLEILESLDRRKSRLENMVCSFVAKYQSTDSLEVENERLDATQSSDQDGLAIARSHMIRALNSALIIYFYRRVQNVNPWILQEHVNSVIRALKDLTSSCARYGLQGPGSPWPCFMAGCEAMSKWQRDYVAEWFEAASRSTGFSRFQAAKSCVYEVWSRRDRNVSDKSRATKAGNMPSWIDVLRERKESVLLS